MESAWGSSDHKTGALVNSEVDFILNRARRFVFTDDEKVSRHRKMLTTDWDDRKRTTCSYPTHRGPRKSIKKPRRVNATMSEEMYQIHHAIARVGSGKCKLRAARPQANVALL